MMDAKKEQTLQKEAGKTKKIISEIKTCMASQAKKIVDAHDYIRDVMAELERVYDLTCPETNAKRKQGEK